MNNDQIKIDIAGGRNQNLCMEFNNHCIEIKRVGGMEMHLFPPSLFKKVDCIHVSPLCSKKQKLIYLPPLCLKEWNFIHPPPCKKKAEFDPCPPSLFKKDESIHFPSLLKKQSFIHPLPWGQGSIPGFYNRSEGDT